MVLERAAWKDTGKWASQSALDLDVPVPGFSSAIADYGGYRTVRLRANMIQAQRDFSGAHTFERVDRNCSFYASWD